jgi:hypothetical protein
MSVTSALRSDRRLSGAEHGVPARRELATWRKLAEQEIRAPFRLTAMRAEDSHPPMNFPIYRVTTHAEYD